MHSQQTDSLPGKGWHWALGCKSLFLDTTLTVNPSSLNSGTNGLSEVVDLTFQITQQKCDDKHKFIFWHHPSSNLKY